MLTEFSIKWSKQINDVKNILNYLNSSEALLKQFNVDRFLSSEELLASQTAWLELISQYNRIEKDFFKSYYIPISYNEYNYYIDISTDKYELFKVYFDSTEPYTYSKIIIVQDVNDILFNSQFSLDVNSIEFSEVMDIMNRKSLLRLKMFSLGGLTEKPVELFQIQKDEEVDIDIYYHESKDQILIKNVTNLIIGLFPKFLPIKILQLNEYNNKSFCNLIYEKVKNDLNENQLEQFRNNVFTVNFLLHFLINSESSSFDFMKIIIDDSIELIFKDNQIEISYTKKNDIVSFIQNLKLTLL